MASKLVYVGIWFVIIVCGVRSAGEVASASRPAIYFTVEPPPLVIARKLKPFSLNCSAQSEVNSASVNITWLKNDEPVNDARRHVQKDGSLYIKRLVKKGQEKDDSGVYQCVARVPQLGAIISRKSQLLIAELGRFTQDPMNTTAAVGENVRLECRVDSSPNLTISWIKDRQPLPPQDRLTILTSGVLQISNAVQSDAGTYRCVAQNEARTYRSKRATLTIRTDQPYVQPRLIAGPKNTTSRLGETVILECIATGVPQPQVVWLRENGAALEMSDRIRLIGVSNLQLTHVKLTDQHSYTCQLANDINTRLQATLTVTEAPRLIAAESSPFSMKTKRLLHVELKCGFTGHPRPTIKWFKDGRHIQDLAGRIRQLENMLTVQSCSDSDTGMYQCMANNTAGTAYHTIYLKVAITGYEPSAPYNLRAETRSSREIILQWDPPLNSNHEIIAYSIHKRTAGQYESQQVVHGTETQIILGDLHPYSNYSMYVVAYTSKAGSNHSQIVNQTTDQDVPVKAPETTVTALSANSIHVRWKPLNKSDAQGRVIGYQIFCREFDIEETEVKHIVESNITEHTITGLEVGKLYQVRVRAGTVAGYPNLEDHVWRWVAVNLSDRSGLPPAPVIQVKALDTSSIQVSWTVYTGPEEITGYTLSCRRTGATHPETQILDHPLSHYIITGLDAETWYTIELSASNSKGVGEAAIDRVQTESERKIEDSYVMDLDLSARALSDRDILLNWTIRLLNEIEKPSLKFVIRYKAIKDGPILPDRQPSLYNITVESPQNEIVVRDLEPYTLYNFFVDVTGSDQESATNKVLCHTLEGRPSAPQYPLLELHEPDYVEVQWKPPVHTNGIILHYYIRYRSSDVSQKLEIKHTENGTARRAMVDGLKRDTIYIFKLQAATSAGPGEETKEIQVSTDGYSGPHYGHERKMGIIVGACIGGSCIFICAVVLYIRSSYCPAAGVPRGHECPTCRQQAHMVPVTRTNGHVGNGLHMYSCAPHHSQTQMMETVPMLQMPHFRADHYMDTKGGPTHNGTNGRSDLQVSIMPNGNISTRVHQNKDSNHVQIPHHEEDMGSREVVGAEPVEEGSDYYEPRIKNGDEWSKELPPEEIPPVNITSDSVPSATGSQHKLGDDTSPAVRQQYTPTSQLESTSSQQHQGLSAASSSSSINPSHIHTPTSALAAPADTPSASTEHCRASRHPTHGAQTNQVPQDNDTHVSNA